MQVIEAIRKFSKTPLKHRMSKYLLDYLLADETMLNRVKLVTTRAYLPDTMMVAQSGAEGPSFELELGVVERDEVSLVNGRLVKQSRKNRALWVHDPVQAVEVLRKFKGILHVEFRFVGSIPDWYGDLAVSTRMSEEMQEEFTEFVRSQIDLAISGILLKDEIDQALASRDRQGFEKKVHQYKQVCDSCLWEL